MKKIIAILLMLAMCACILSACSETDNDVPEEETNPAVEISREDAEKARDTAVEYLSDNPYKVTTISVTDCESEAVLWDIMNYNDTEIYINDGKNIFYSLAGEDKTEYTYIEGILYQYLEGREGDVTKIKEPLNEDELQHTIGMTHFPNISTKYFTSFECVENGDGTKTIIISRLSEERIQKMNENYKEMLSYLRCTFEIKSSAYEFVIGSHGELLSVKSYTEYVADGEKYGENVPLTVTRESIYEYENISVAAPKDADEYQLSND